MKLAWGNKVSEEFCLIVLGMVHRLVWTEEQASHLMSCMAFESGETFSAQIRNAAGSGAVGLIQFMPSTAAGLGTTTENLELLRPESQLYYVERYFRPYAHRIKTLSDMYMAILMPKYIGQPDTAKIFSGGVVYRQNAGLDANRDGSVTKAEAAAKVAAKLAKGLGEGYYREMKVAA